MKKDQEFLEIVHLRLAVDVSGTLVEDVLRSVTGRAMDGSLTIFRRVGLAGDITCHIVRRRSSGTDGMSALGLHLASQLRDLGIVEHSLWTEAGHRFL